MRNYRSIRMSGAGDFIASVSGSTGDYDLTLDDGTVFAGYDETTGTFSTAAPQAGDLLVFGIYTGQRLMTAANAEVIPAASAAAFIIPEDAS
jgi:hypothetical protein